KTKNTPLKTVRVVSGLLRPVFVTFAPGDFDRIFIVQKTGQIRVVQAGKLLDDPFLDLSERVSGTTEQGLLGLAFHPNYNGDSQSPGFGNFFVNYTKRISGDTVIARYTVSDNPDVADDTTAESILPLDQPNRNHNGGWIAFGPDGFLYIATGDGGEHFDPDKRGQTITDNLLGKILRIDVNGDDFPKIAARNYAIPPDNPFVNKEGDDEIWAYGLRNPWRNAFDTLTGDLYIADVGEAEQEEVNVQPADSTGGENYGWRCMEGDACTGLSGCTCNSDLLTDPIHTYTHDDDGSPCSITGGEVYRGSAIPDLQGAYFFADYCSNQIWSLRYDATPVTDFRDRTCELQPPGELTLRNISSFGLDAAGELYICDLFGGEVFKIVPATGIINSVPPTGAVDARRPFSPDGTGNEGWDSIELSMDVNLQCLSAASFTVSQEGGKGSAPEVLDIEEIGPGRLRVRLNRIIEVGAWTTITHVASGASVRIGYLPGDVNGDGVTAPHDILDLIDALNKVGGPVMIWSQDIDRSGLFAPADLLQLVDLFTGVGLYDPFLGASLPQ
ncbi:MAG: PQQ-dependent sugar dehydrogenase, partial [Planctomycetes bacterium]|nr:PQQ-dependent sugar dehydrogenase [Planctomycetota bacterium]